MKHILDEISAESSTNGKLAILNKHKYNTQLERVLYLAYSKRVKFFIKQIPPYSSGQPANTDKQLTLQEALTRIGLISDRTFTGLSAIQFLSRILAQLKPDDAYIIERIIDKDCKIGCGPKLINRVFPDLIEKTGYMGCKPYSKAAIEKILARGWAYSQEKMDGRYINVVIQGGEVFGESRQGEPTILDNPRFCAELATLPDCVFNGELTMEGVSRYISNGIISSLISISEKKQLGENIRVELAKFEAKNKMSFEKALDLVVFTAWDMLTIDEYFTRKCTRPYYTRLAALYATIGTGFSRLAVVETRAVTTFMDVLQHFEEVVSRNGEGTVVKSRAGVWVDSKPAYQIKVKKEVTLDLVITGFNYGTPGSKNEHVISSLNAETAEGLLKTKPQGISEDDMLYITKNQDRLLGTIIEIKCSGLSQNFQGDYSTLHPVFKCFRTDKSEANTLEECIEINDSSSF